MTNSIFETIRCNLTRVYIFYIPTSRWELVQDTIYKDTVPKELLDTVVFLDKEQKTTADVSKFQKFHFAEKGLIFDETMFMLLDAKETLSAAQFDHLFKKYWEHLDSFTFIAQWMHENIHTCFVAPEESIVSLFALQRQCFVKHHELMVQKYGQPEGNSWMDDWRNKIHTKVTVPVSLPDFQKKETKTLPVPKAKQPVKKKQELISDEEVDALLLETVFHVTL
ncbi:hypothetical protein [Formosa sp. A9]|uniref:hypothetical protein n=1 Tax=Formosa sp. A9 TaxID=3442641 RepID=UPI003EBA96CA